MWIFTWVPFLKCHIDAIVAHLVLATGLHVLWRNQFNPDWGGAPGPGLGRHKWRANPEGQWGHTTGQCQLIGHLRCHPPPQNCSPPRSSMPQESSHEDITGPLIPARHYTSSLGEVNVKCSCVVGQGFSKTQIMVLGNEGEAWQWAGSRYAAGTCGRWPPTPLLNCLGGGGASISCLKYGDPLQNINLSRFTMSNASLPGLWVFC